MQLICEAYHLLSQVLGLDAYAIALVFERWNTGVLSSYLMEISAEVLRQQDPLSDKPLVEMILDKAGQKGTGLWTAVSSLQIGCPAPTIAEAVYARAISTQKVLRQSLASKLVGPEARDTQSAASDEQQSFIDGLESALYCAKVSCYAQGFQLMAMQAQEQGWQLDFAAIARIWRAGCIIRARFLQSIAAATTASRNWPICCWPMALLQRFRRASRHGGKRLPRRYLLVCLCPASHRRFLTTTVIAVKRCQPICCRGNGTFSERIVLSA